ncbi:MAG TPA: tetratricopeptide repeat protein [Gemmata sp.]|jgi:tetratricopeptide (TPR) repeat protein|nr:tetratricopeptide repeat protein [Gemmata sp.]
MNRFAIVLLFGLVPASIIRAEDDEWVGQILFPRSNGVQVRDKDGKEITKWTLSAAKVLKEKKDSLLVRLGQPAGPAEGYVKKEDVVNLVEAATFYSDKVKQDEKDTWARLCRGQVWSLVEDYDKAIKDFDEVIQLDPKNASAFTNRAAAWFGKEEFDKAIKDYDEAIKINPKAADAFIGRGQTRASKQEYDKAIDDYTEAIKINPKYFEAFIARGEAWNEKKEYDKAIKDLDEAVRLDPKSASAFNGRARVWYARQEYEKAIKDYTQAIKLDAEQDDALNGLAWLLATCPQAKYRDGKRAVELATKACEVSEWEEAGYIDTLAASYAETGDFDKAIKYEKQAIELLTEEEEKRLGDEFRARLKLFEQKKPFHEPEKKE